MAEITIYHEEKALVNLGDIPHGLLADYLKNDQSWWTLSDLNNTDWKITKIVIDGKEYA